MQPDAPGSPPGAFNGPIEATLAALHCVNCEQHFLPGQGLWASGPQRSKVVSIRHHLLLFYLHEVDA